MSWWVGGARAVSPSPFFCALITSTHARTHARTHTRAHTHTRTHTHTCAHIHTPRRGYQRPKWLHHPQRKDSSQAAQGRLEGKPAQGEAALQESQPQLTGHMPSVRMSDLSSTTLACSPSINLRVLPSLSHSVSCFIVRRVPFSSALHLACARDHRAIVTHLLAMKANVNIVDRNCSTALHKVSRVYSVEFCHPLGCVIVIICNSLYNFR